MRRRSSSWAAALGVGLAALLGVGTVVGEGLPDSDPIAPSIAVSSAKVTKLRRPVGTYSLRLVLAIRDDVEDNPVGYAVIVKGGGLELARRVGSTASVTVRIAVRVRPPSTRVRRITFRVTALDPVGNESSLTRSLTLPR